VHFGRRINRAYRDEETGEVAKETIVNLNIPLSDTPTDAFVLDNVVAVQINDGAFKFFPIPLIRGEFVDAIPIVEVTDSDNANFISEDEFKRFKAVGFAPNKGSQVVHMFAISDSQLIRVSYVYDKEANSVS